MPEKSGHSPELDARKSRPGVRGGHALSEGVRDALDEAMCRSLTPVMLAVGVLYLVFGISHWFALTGRARAPMMIVALCTGLALLGLWLLLRRTRVPARWSHEIGAGVAGLVLLNSGLHFIFLPHPSQTTNFLMLLVGAGFFLFSSFWLAVLIVSTLGVWGIVAAGAPPSDLWGHFGFALLSATVLSWLVHVVRVRTLIRLEDLRLRDDLQKAALASALEAAESARKEAEVARVSAETANRAKSQFLANMSHEIRTPLNAVNGFSELLSDQAFGPLNEKQAQYVHNILSCGRQLLGLINDILDFSKIEAGRLDLDRVVFDLPDVLRSQVEVAKVRAQEKGLRLGLEMGAGVPARLSGDPGRLGQIITNLMDNAIKFTEEGDVVLGAELDAAQEDECRVKFWVRDTGIGIPEDKQRMIFEAFAQADGSTTRRYGGTGLGLTISGQLAHIMGGRLWVESVPGDGSTFFFTATFGVSPQDEDELDALDPKVLYERLDGDEDLLREVVRLFLENVTAQVEAVQNALDAESAEELIRASQSLGGALGEVGAGRALGLARKLEEAGHRGELDGLAGLRGQLETEIERVNQALVLLATGQEAAPASQKTDE